jgi:hypothetical protein
MILYEAAHCQIANPKISKTSRSSTSLACNVLTSNWQKDDANKDCYKKKLLNRIPYLIQTSIHLAAYG